MKNNIGKNLFIVLAVGSLVSNSMVAFGGGAYLPSSAILGPDIAYLEGKATEDANRDIGAKQKACAAAAVADQTKCNSELDVENKCLAAIDPLKAEAHTDLSALTSDEASTTAAAKLSIPTSSTCAEKQCHQAVGNTAGIGQAGAGAKQADANKLAAAAADISSKLSGPGPVCSNLKAVTRRIQGDATQIAGQQGMSMQEMAALGQMAQGTMGALASLAKNAAAASSGISGPTAPTDPTATSMTSPSAAGGTMGGVSAPSSTGTVANTGAAGGGAGLPNFGLPSENSPAGTGSGQAVGSMGGNSPSGVSSSGGLGGSASSAQDSKAPMTGSLTATASNPLTPLDDSMGAGGGGGSSMLGLKSSKDFDAGLPPPDLGGAKDPGASPDAGMDRGLASGNAGGDLVAQNDVNSANTNLFDVMSSKMRDMARRGAL